MTTGAKKADEAKKDTKIDNTTAADAKKAEGQNVVGAQTTDNSPATGGGDHANIAIATQDPKNANVVTDNVTTQPKVVGHDDPATAGTSDYVADSEGDVESPVPSDEVLEAMDKNLGYKVGESQLTDTDRENARESADKIVKMIKSMPADAKDSLVIYGYGGFILYLGDLRKILRGHPGFEDDAE